MDPRNLYHMVTHSHSYVALTYSIPDHTQALYQETNLSDSVTTSESRPQSRHSYCPK